MRASWLLLICAAVLLCELDAASVSRDAKSVVVKTSKIKKSASRKVAAKDDDSNGDKKSKKAKPEEVQVDTRKLGKLLSSRKTSGASMASKLTKIKKDNASSSITSAKSAAIKSAASSGKKNNKIRNSKRNKRGRRSCDGLKKRRREKCEERRRRRKRRLQLLKNQRAARKHRLQLRKNQRAARKHRADWKRHSRAIRLLRLQASRRQWYIASLNRAIRFHHRLAIEYGMGEKREFKLAAKYRKRKLALLRKHWKQVEHRKNQAAESHRLWRAAVQEQKRQRARWHCRNSASSKLASCIDAHVKWQRMLSRARMICRKHKKASRQKCIQRHMRDYKRRQKSG